jgi:hypothetical protein
MELHDQAPSALEIVAVIVQKCLRIEGDGDRRMNRDDPRFLEFCLKNLKVGMFIAEPHVAYAQANRLGDAQACAGQEPEQRRENDWTERIVRIWAGRRADQTRHFVVREDVGTATGGPCHDPRGRHLGRYDAGQKSEKAADHHEAVGSPSDAASCRRAIPGPGNGSCRGPHTAAVTIPDISARSIGRVAEHALVLVRRRPPVGRWGIDRRTKLGGCMPSPARVVEHGAQCFFNGWRSTPSAIPATSQLDWLISMTAISVASCSRVTRDLLKSFSCGMGRSMIRWSDDGAIVLGARPIASVFKSHLPVFSLLFAFGEII